MKQASVKILANERIKNGVFKMRLAAPAIARSASPGQFVMVRCSDICQPLLRRPFSVHSVREQRTPHHSLRSGAGQAENPAPFAALRCGAGREQIGILYEVAGEATEILSQKKTGERLDIIGPLGNGFSYPLNAIRYPLSILIAGGIGAAPLLFLAETLLAHRVGVVCKCDYTYAVCERCAPPVVLLGAKTKSSLLCVKEFKRLGCEVKIATDDGSAGHKGYVTELLKEIAQSINFFSPQRGEKIKMRGANPVFLPPHPNPLPLRGRGHIMIYGCGPRAMLKEVAAISQRHNIPAQVSLEAHMACGIGACLGCVVNAKDGYKRVCKEGPVFDAKQIIWE